MKEVTSLIPQVIPILALLVTTTAAAASPPQDCGTSPRQVLYAAEFGPAGHRMKIEVGPESARIWSGNQCEAICQASLGETSVELQCHSVKFQPLSTPATLFWLAGWSGAPVLRFGTWLDGFEDYPVNAKLNQLPGVVARNAPKQGEKPTLF